METTKPKLLTTTECASWLRVSANTLKAWRWARRNQVPHSQIGPEYLSAGKKILYEQDAVERWIRNSKNQEA